jgi:hypothetical protein
MHHTLRIGIVSGFVGLRASCLCSAQEGSPPPLLPTIQQATHDANATALSPRALFVAWNGVIVLAFDGFPPALASIKKHINASTDIHLVPEGFGSKWPKTTLGAFADDAPELTIGQLDALRTLCKNFGPALSQCAIVPIHTLSVVDYKARSLEFFYEPQRLDFALRGPFVTERTCVAERARVTGVLSEWDDLSSYLPKVNKPGSRNSSYREKSPEGSTLVAFWADGQAEDLQQQLRLFRAEVDALLPGYYVWHDELSLHCTLRALRNSYVINARSRHE